MACVSFPRDLAAPTYACRAVDRGRFETSNRNKSSEFLGDFLTSSAGRSAALGVDCNPNLHAWTVCEMNAVMLGQRETRMTTYDERLTNVENALEHLRADVGDLKVTTHDLRHDLGEF